MYISLTLSVYHKKFKISIAVIQKQIIMKIIILWLWRESEKTVVEWFWRVLARVRLADWRQVSKPAQGSTVGALRVCANAYLYRRTHDFGHANVDTYAPFLYDFSKVFQIFLVLMILYCFWKLLAINVTFNLFLCPWKRQILCCLHLFHRNLFCLLLMQAI